MLSARAPTPGRHRQPGAGRAGESPAVGLDAARRTRALITPTSPLGSYQYERRVVPAA